MKLNSVRRDGFTLAEVLITIAIIAVLAAVLLPVLTGQLRKGDIARVTSDITSVRTGMEAFLADVKRVPGTVDQLVDPLVANSAASSSDANGVAYPQGLVNRWRGPYLDKEQDAGIIATGFGGSIVNSFSSTPPGLAYNNINWAIIRITGIAAADLNEIDLAIDEAANSSTGRFRYNASSTAFYFAVPRN